MKKSTQSLLTAAMFAAALTTSAGGSAVFAQDAASSEATLMAQTGSEPQDVYGPPNWFETDPEQVELTEPIEQPAYGPPYWETERTDVTEPITQPAYGPPIWFSDTETGTTTTEPIPQTEYGPPYWETTTPDITEIIPQPAYGPPWMFAAPGDLNYDFSLDARDLTLLKRYLLSGKMDDASYRLANVNGDGEIDKKDVKELIRKLTGKPEDEDDPDVTTTATDATQPPESETTTDPWWDYPLPLYGPPAAY